MVLLIAAIVVVPPGVSLAMYRTRVWWLVGALMIGAAAWTMIWRGADDDAFVDLEGVVRVFAAAALAIYGGVILAVTHLTRRTFTKR